MQKRKKLAVIGTLLIVLVAGGIVWQVVDVNRTGRSPVSALFKNEGQEASSNEPSADPVTIVLREEVPTPTPSPTPSPTPTSAPTPTSTPTSAPAESSKTGSTSGFRLKVGHQVRKQAIKTLLKNPKQRQNQRQRSRLRLGRRSLRQRRNPLPSRRCKTSHLIHTASIFCPETAGASTLPQHLVIFIAWAHSGCAATPLLSLSQVPILPASPSRP